MAFTIDVSTLTAIKQGYTQIRTKWEKIYVLQVAELLACPRNISNLGRGQIETRKLYGRNKRDIVTVSNMLHTEIWGCSSSASGAMQDNQLQAEI